MPETHDLGPLFVHSVALERGTRVIHRAPTNEIEEPYRRSNSLVVRLFGRKGWVFGWWKHDPDRTEDEALLAALTLGAHGGRTYEDEAAIALLYPASEKEDRGESEGRDRGVGDAGNARPAVIYL